VGYVTGLFRMFASLLKGAREQGRLDPAWLGDYRMTVERGLRSLLRGLVVEVAVEVGFHPSIDERWELTIGSSRRRIAFDATLRGPGLPTVVVEVDTLAEAGYAWGERRAPRYVVENPQLFEGRLVKPVLLKLALAQHGSLDAALHLVTLPTSVTRPPPSRPCRGNLYEALLPRYLSEAGEAPKPYYLVVLREGVAELYSGGALEAREEW